MQDQMDQLTQNILRWRKLELFSWSLLLASLLARLREETSQLWLHLASWWTWCWRPAAPVRSWSWLLSGSWRPPSWFGLTSCSDLASYTELFTHWDTSDKDWGSSAKYL